MFGIGLPVEGVTVHGSKVLGVLDQRMHALVFGQSLDSLMQQDNALSSHPWLQRVACEISEWSWILDCQRVLGLLPGVCVAPYRAGRVGHQCRHAISVHSSIRAEHMGRYN